MAFALFRTYFPKISSDEFSVFFFWNFFIFCLIHRKCFKKSRIYRGSTFCSNIFHKQYWKVFWKGKISIRMSVVFEWFFILLSTSEVMIAWNVCDNSFDNSLTMFYFFSEIFMIFSAIACRNISEVSLFNFSELLYRWFFPLLRELSYKFLQILEKF